MFPCRLILTEFYLAYSKSTVSQTVLLGYCYIIQLKVKNPVLCAVLSWLEARDRRLYGRVSMATVLAHIS